MYILINFKSSEIYIDIFMSLKYQRWLIFPLFLQEYIHKSLEDHTSLYVSCAGHEYNSQCHRFGLGCMLPNVKSWPRVVAISCDNFTGQDQYHEQLIGYWLKSNT